MGATCRVRRVTRLPPADPQPAHRPPSPPIAQPHDAHGSQALRRAGLSRVHRAGDATLLRHAREASLKETDATPTPRMSSPRTRLFTPRASPPVSLGASPRPAPVSGRRDPRLPSICACICSFPRPVSSSKGGVCVSSSAAAASSCLPLSPSLPALSRPLPCAASAILAARRASSAGSGRGAGGRAGPGRGGGGGVGGGGLVVHLGGGPRDTAGAGREGSGRGGIGGRDSAGCEARTRDGHRRKGSGACPSARACARARHCAAVAARGVAVDACRGGVAARRVREPSGDRAHAWRRRCDAAFSTDHRRRFSTHIRPPPPPPAPPLCLTQAMKCVTPSPPPLRLTHAMKCVANS